MSATAGSISFSAVSAAKLAQADGRSDTDPYVRWSANGKTIAETHFLRNVMGRRGRTPGAEKTPRWDSEYTASLPRVVNGPLSITVSLWDSDRGQDDPLGDATFELAVTAGVQHFSLPLTNVPTAGLESSVTFSATVELPLRPPPVEEPEDEAPAAAPQLDAGPVERKEIRSMPEEEQERYAEAIKKMMEDANGPESSEFFRLAGYHGWPGKGTDRVRSQRRARVRTHACTLLP